MFTGEYEHSIDTKHRLAIPADIRSQLDPQVHGEGFYVGPGANGFLWIWPQRTFEQMAEALEGTLLPDEDLMEFEELLFSQSSRVEMDKVGRIRLPERLRRRYGLESGVIILGIKDHLELRPAAGWEGIRDAKLEKHGDIVLRARAALKARSNGGGGAKDARP